MIIAATQPVTCVTAYGPVSSHIRICNGNTRATARALKWPRLGYAGLAPLSDEAHN